MEGFKEQQVEGYSKTKSKPQTEYTPGKVAESLSDIADRETADAELYADLQGLDDSEDKDSTKVAEKEESKEIFDEKVDELILKYKSNIEEVAERRGVDKNTMAAIIYKEQTSLDLRDRFDYFGAYYLNSDTSIGLGQIKVSTGVSLIWWWYIMKPTAGEIRVCGSVEWVTASRLRNDYRNIEYVGAYLQKIQDVRKGKFSKIAERPDILYTIYNKGLEKCPPRPNPESNNRGKEVKKDLYPHVQQLMS